MTACCMSSQELYGSKAASVISAHDTDDPLFLYVALQNIHAPLEARSAKLNLHSGVTPLKRKKTLGGPPRMLPK